MATSDYTSEIPYGYCHCGCGQKTSLSKTTCKKRNLVKGEPVRYIHNHHGRYSHQEQIDVFWANVAITADDNQCWLWTAGCYGSGYGQTIWNGFKDSAHRVAWSYPDYVIPDGMFICHSCDTPLCCNPKHLFLGTPADNTHDMDAKGRRVALKGELSGMSKLTQEIVDNIRNVYAKGGITYKQLATQYHVDDSTIGMIINFYTWKNPTS